MNLSTLQVKLRTYTPPIGIALIAIVLVSIIFTLLIKKPLPMVIQTNPANNQKYARNTTPISITFQKSLTKKEIDKIQVNLIPQTELNISWKTDSHLEVIPKSPLKTSTLYNIDIIYSKKAIHSFSFTTNKFSTQELQEQIKQQAGDDLLFGEAFYNISQQYPWYHRLPIERKPTRRTLLPHSADTITNSSKDTFRTLVSRTL